MLTPHMYRLRESIVDDRITLMIRERDTRSKTKFYILVGIIILVGFFAVGLLFYQQLESNPCFFQKCDCEHGCSCVDSIYVCNQDPKVSAELRRLASLQEILKSTNYYYPDDFTVEVLETDLDSDYLKINNIDLYDKFRIDYSVAVSVFNEDSESDRVVKDVLPRVVLLN
ncbi:MAG TPA: hypothetical protein ENN64_00880, partial [bacterium]|nr:hypothetical protein [bacterium]